MKGIGLIIVATISYISFAQQPLIVYFDKDWQVSDSSNAIYMRTLFADGQSHMYSFTDFLLPGFEQVQNGFFSDESMQIKQGAFQNYYPTDSNARFAKQQVKESGMYCTNIKCDAWKLFDSSGNLIQQENFNAYGERNGVSEWFSIFKNNYRIDSSKTFQKDRLNGPSSYYENGVLKSVFWYSNDVLDSVQFFDEYGEKIPSHEAQDRAAYFESGEKQLKKILSSERMHPADAKGVKGTVIVRFYVNERGEIGLIEIEKSVHPSLDAEAIRLVSLLGDYVPARRNNCAVPSIVYLEIKF